jgi:hypothetical protein
MRLFHAWLLLLLLTFLLPLSEILYSTTLEERRAILRNRATTYGLTDFCLSTESRHLRHVSQPEWIAPFQDFPAYQEHFPASSFFVTSPTH